MRQQSITVEDVGKYRKKTRKEMFLEEMDEIISWQDKECSQCIYQMRIGKSGERETVINGRPGRIVCLDFGKDW